MKLKSIWLSFFMLCCIFMNAHAEEAFKRDLGVSIGSTGQLDFRKLINGSYMIYAGLSYSSSNYGFTNKTASNGYGLMLGARRYLNDGSLKNFVNLEFSKNYTNLNSDLGGEGKAHSSNIYLAYGIEYYISANVSLEGKAGVRYSDMNQTDSISTYSSSGYALPVASLALNYYWK